MTSVNQINLLTIIQVSLVQILLLDSYRTASSLMLHRLLLIVALHWRSCFLPKASLIGHIQAWKHRDPSLVVVPSYDVLVTVGFQMRTWVWPNGRYLT